MVEKREVSSDFNQERMEVADFSPEVQFVIDVARKGRLAALTKFGEYQADARLDEVSHDESFNVDAPVEEMITKMHDKAWKDGKMYGFVTEEQNMQLPNENPEWIIEYDPVDGSRTAQSGDEQACFVAFGIKGDKKDDARMKDIEFGVALAIKENKMFVTDTTGVYEVFEDGTVKPMSVAENVSNELSHNALLFEVFSTNMVHMGKAIAPLASAVRWNMVYPCGSYMALSVSRQGKIHTDIRDRLLKDFGDNLDIVKKDTKVVKFLAPMDIGAQYQMIKKTGGVVTDAYGDSLDEAVVWQKDESGKRKLGGSISWVAAPTPELHKKTMEKLEEGFKSFGR